MTISCLLPAMKLSQENAANADAVKLQEKMGAKAVAVGVDAAVATATGSHVAGTVAYVTASAVSNELPCGIKMTAYYIANGLTLGLLDAIVAGKTKS